jgi:hypothetical protein
MDYGIELSKLSIYRLSLLNIGLEWRRHPHLRLTDLEVSTEFFEYYTPLDCLVSGFWHLDSHWERLDYRYG